MATYVVGSTSLSPQSNLDTPEGEISAIQSGRMQPLPTYTELDNSTDPLISTVDPSDTRHIPPSYTEETLTKQETITDTTPIIRENHAPFVPAPVSDRLYASASPFYREAWRTPLPADPANDTESSRERRRYETITAFFNAIYRGEEELIDLLLTRNLVTANTINWLGKTPLLEAVDTRNMRTVQQLLDAGAEPDAFGVVEGHARANSLYPAIYRTPLQLSASLGHLPMVKLFLETYHCNDALIAPDGQIALRLAASNNHREVVAYLPSRRGGGFLRWKTAHALSLRRAKSAIESIRTFILFFTWEVPRFLLWSCPKHLVVLPILKAWKYCWTNKRRFAEKVLFEIQQTPARLARAAKWVWGGIMKIPHGIHEIGKHSLIMAREAFQALLRGLKKLPTFLGKFGKATGKLIAELVKALWEFLTVDVPKIVKHFCVWMWEVLTVHLPKAVGIAAKWIYHGILSVLKALGDVVLKVASLVHTVLTAVVTFFQDLSLTDIINGVKAVLTAVFVTLPVTVGKWIKGFGEASYKVMGALFGWVGKCVWWIITGLGWVAVYVPRKLWTVVKSMGESLGKGMHEILVFFRPKA